MNEWEVNDAQDWFDPEDQPNLHQGAVNLLRLMNWTNARSDGWAYWVKPRRAAAKLMDMLKAGRELNRSNYAGDLIDVTDVTFKAAMTPVKSLITREGDYWEKVFNPPPAPDPIRGLRHQLWQEGWEHYRTHFSPNDPEYGKNPYA